MVLCTLAINDSTLSDMDISDSYLTTLPKVYLYTLLSESFSMCVETVVANKVFLSSSFFQIEWASKCRRRDTQETVHGWEALSRPAYRSISSEHEALELADKVEASLVTWRCKTGGLSHSKSSWDMIKDIGDAERGNDKNHILAAPAGGPGACSFVWSRDPELSQTSLEICKIQYDGVSNT